MATGKWVSITPFKLEEVSGPITGKWLSLFEELAKQLPAYTPPNGLVVAFEDMATAKRAGAAVVKLFNEKVNKRAIRTAVRVHDGKPSLLVWHGDAWGGYLAEPGEGEPDDQTAE